MKKRGLSVLLSLALTVTSIFGGFSAKSQAAEVKAAQTPGYRNVMYYGEWSVYAGQKYFYPSKIDGSQITHLNFAFLDVDANGDLVLCDEYADFQITSMPELSGTDWGNPNAGVFGALNILRSKYPNMKIGVSVGGWTRSGDFPKLAASAATRQNFAKNIAKFVDYLGYDFVDIDWEYPTADRDPDPEGNGVTIDKGCKGSEADTENFTLMLQAIRDELSALEKKTGKYYELSVAMSASPAMMAKIEYDKVLDIVDFANMMTYDLNGAWNAYTGHQTALYTNPAYDKETQKDGQFSVDTCIQYLKDTYGNKIDYSKVVIGVAPYTRGWAEVKNDGPDAKNPGLYATAAPNSVKAPDGTTSGTFAYGDIDTLISQYQLKEYYDETAQAAYYYSPETGYFFTCDNERSVAAKGNYVKEQGLGGLISWMASLDSTNSLTKTMKDSLYGNAKLPDQEVVVTNPNVDVSITASGSQYSITIKNNETATESNAALKYAELVKKTVTYPTLYIKTKSGNAFSAGSQSGTVTNANGYGVIDLSGVYGAKMLEPGKSFTFTVNVAGNADVTDIEGVTMTQRLLASSKEYGAQTVYGEGSGGNIPGGDDTEKNTEDNSEKNTEDNSEKNTEDDTEKNTEGGTGTYAPWKSGETYKVGDLVSHKDKVYECIINHTSHDGWKPDEGGETLWKVRPDLVNIPSGGGDDNPEEPGNNYYVNGMLPQHMVTGYWHNFVNGSANLKLSDVPAYYDMICVAFTGNTTTPGEVTFELDGDLCNALGGYTKAEFIQDIKDLKQKGQHVIISVGGAEGRIEIDSDEAGEKFAEGLIGIIEEYGFEGVDIDLEGSAVSGTDYIADALRTVHNHFGKDFIITMAPETYYIQADRLSSNDITTAYLRLALKIKDILTICYPQFYNSGGMNGYGGSIVNPGSADFLTSLSTLVIETGGLRPDQVAIGVPSTSLAATSGYVSTDVVKTAVDAMINGTSSGGFTAPKAYPTFRGVMTWSINWDATNNYEWAKAMDEAMSKLPVVDNGSTDPGDKKDKPVTGVTLDKTSITLEEGAFETLKATVAPADATNKTVTWSSSDTSVATVSGGVVVGKKAGEAQITVKTNDGNKTAVCDVTVKEKEQQTISVTGVTVNRADFSLEQGMSEQIKASVEPSNATNQAVTWKSSDTSVATVSKDGIVTAVKPGTAVITVTSDDGAKTASITVTIKERDAATVSVTGVTLNTAALNLKEGETASLQAAIEPSNATNKNVFWKSSDENVVFVSSEGSVLARKEGEATITAITADGSFQAVCAVTVTPVAVESVSVSETSLTLPEGISSALTAVITPSNASNRSVTWTSSDERVATVSEDGVVTAVTAGNATITVTTADGNKTAVVTVTVTKREAGSIRVESVELNKSALELEVNEDASLAAAVTPASATYKHIIWKSSDSSVAIVTSDGQILALKEGKTIITATAADGGATAACAVTVKAKGAVETKKYTVTFDSNGGSAVASQTVAEGGTAAQPAAPVKAGFIFKGWKLNNAPYDFKAAVNGDITLVAQWEAVNAPASAVKVTGLKISGISKKIAAGKKVLLAAVATPANAANASVTWSVKADKNAKYASVDAKTGLVTTKKAGKNKTVTIVATANDGSGVTAEYKIKLMAKAVKKIALKVSSNPVKAGKKIKIKATVTPKASAKKINSKLKWESSNPKYATVTSKGVVKTKKAGKGKTVKITARATDGTNKKKTVKIKIK